MAVASTAVLWALVGVAAVWDIVQRRIPNALILSGLALGLAIQTQTGGFAGLGSGVLGAAVAFLILILPFALRAMGGGDVKLAMVAGAFLGWHGAIHVIVYGAVFHGLLAATFVVARRMMMATGRSSASLERVPHAVGFAAATLLYTQNLGHLF